MASVLDLTTATGPAKEKATYFILDGEPAGSIPNAPYVGKHDVVLMMGDMGTGKTSNLADWLIWSAWLYPGCNLGVFRATLQNLKRTTLDKLEERLKLTGSEYGKEEISLLYEKNKQDYVYTFPEWGGSRIFAFGLDTGDPVAKLKSFESFRNAIDEANEIDAEVGAVAMLRPRQKVRHRTLGVEGWNATKMVSNLDAGEDHWLWQTFFDRGREIKKDIYQVTAHWTEPATGKTYYSTGLGIKIYHWENQSLSDAPRRVAGLIPEEVRKRFLGGEPAKKTGLVYPEFKRNLHVIPPVDIPIHYPVWVGIDHGVRHPTVAVAITRDDDNNFIIFREYVVRDALAADNARAILSQYSDLYQNRIEWYGDPSMWMVKGYDKAIAELYIEEGIPLEPSTRTASINLKRGGDDDMAMELIRTWLRPKSVMGGEAKPRLYVTEDSPETIKQFRNLTWENLAKIEKDDVFKAVRYAVARIPEFYSPGWKPPSEFKSHRLNWRQ